MKKILSALSVLFFFTACQTGDSKKEENTSSEQASVLDDAHWRGVIKLNDSTELAFNFETAKNDSGWSFVIHNAEERIKAQALAQGDSFKVVVPVFANYLILKPTGDKLDGYYINPDAKDYRLPFKAMKGDTSRYHAHKEPCCDLNKKWAVQLSTEKETSRPAIAYFNQLGQNLTGTFVTETGDYRYLEGIVSGDSFKLSAFDGAHLFYFEGNIDNGQKIYGEFYSGRSYYTKWEAYRDDDFTLRDPEQLTYLKEGYDALSFTFPNLSGDSISLSDSQFAGKPVIVQIMGSWCPNCMDESRYFRELHEQYHPDGLEIIGLTFERAGNRETAIKRASKMKSDLNLPYPILLAGATREDEATELLPMLNHIMSYPTSIYLNRDHEVVKIHTGFAGPGTPEYESYIRENNTFVESLVN